LLVHMNTTRLARYKYTENTTTGYECFRFLFIKYSFTSLPCGYHHDISYLHDWRWDSTSGLRSHSYSAQRRVLTPLAIYHTITCVRDGKWHHFFLPFSILVKLEYRTERTQRRAADRCTFIGTSIHYLTGFYSLI